MKTSLFRIEGMHCEGCARTIEALIASQAGIRKASVSFATKEARILFDPQAIDEDRLAKAIRDLGFTVALRPS